MIILKIPVGVLISVPGEFRAESANNAIVAYFQIVTSDLHIKVTSDLYIKITCHFYETVLIIFIESSAIINFWADTFAHSPSKHLQQILSTKKIQQLCRHGNNVRI